MIGDSQWYLPLYSGFSNNKIFFNRSCSFSYLPPKIRCDRCKYALYCHLHTVIHNRIVVHVLQRSQYYIVIYSLRSISAKMHRRLHTHTQRADLRPMPLYFYFYFVCRTSHIPGELIISVFNFLPLVCVELCVLNTKRLERFAGVSCVTWNPYVIVRIATRKKSSDQSRAIKTRCDLSIYQRVAMPKSGVIRFL